MKCTFLPVYRGNGLKPVACVGPSHNLRPEARKHLTQIQKQLILQRQHSTCNACGERIQLYPYANCDAGHVIGVCRGGKTVPANMQLLCVKCHRNKSAREASGVPRTVELALEPGDTNVYIFTCGKMAFPVDKRTPLEAIANGCGLSLLAFKKVDRSVRPDASFTEMLQKFVYTPATLARCIAE